MIEVWTAGVSELVVPPEGRSAYSGYVMKTGNKTYRGYEDIGKGKDMTEDVASYNALIHATEKIKSLELDGEKIIVKSSSRALVRQMARQRRVRTERLKSLFYKAKILTSNMDIVFEWIPKRKNKEAYNHIRDGREAGKHFQF